MATPLRTEVRHALGSRSPAVDPGSGTMRRPGGGTPR